MKRFLNMLSVLTALASCDGGQMTTQHLRHNNVGILQRANHTTLVVCCAGRCRVKVDDTVYDIPMHSRMIVRTGSVFTLVAMD